MQSVISRLLTKEQIEKGFTIDFNDHVVTLKYKDKIVGHYSTLGVTIETLRQDADTYINGIEFTKQ